MLRKKLAKNERGRKNIWHTFFNNFEGKKKHSSDTSVTENDLCVGEKKRWSAVDREVHATTTAIYNIHTFSSVIQENKNKTVTK